jgi:hypothetical protein
LPILTAINIEILLATCEYYGKSSISSSLIETIEAPSEHRSRIGSDESEAKKLEAII